MVKSGKSFEEITGGEQTYGEGCDDGVIFDIAASQSASLIELIEASTNHKPLSGR
jgi:hypothetical protein